MKYRTKGIIQFFLILLLVAGTILIMAFSGYFKSKPDDYTGHLDKVDGPIDLGTVEVGDYQGKKLGSIDDFRENSIRGPQYIDESSYRLKITGLVEEELVLTYDEVLESTPHYRKVVTLNCVEGWSVTILWEGLLLRDLIDMANATDEGKVLILKAKDGYSTSLAMEYFYNNDILMAYGMNDVTIPPERGFPFQLVAESKWGYKWIKWITEIEVSDDIDYEGYWEERGYDNEGDLDTPPFG